MNTIAEGVALLPESDDDAFQSSSSQSLVVELTALSRDPLGDAFHSFLSQPPVVELESVSFEYATVPGAGIHDVDLSVRAGEIVVLCGPSGSGKSTVTRVVNGLIPNFFEGPLSGRVTVAGVDAPKAPVTQLAQLTGSVFQDPRTQFFTGDTTSELAFGPENLGWDPALIETRVDIVSSALGLTPLLDRSILALSGGEQQRLACAVASMADPAVLLLDEPSSTLDGAAVGTLTQALRQWKSAGKAILIAEHRLDYLAEIADHFIYFDQGRITGRYTRDEFLALGPTRWEELGLRSPLRPNPVKQGDGSAVSPCRAVNGDNSTGIGNGSGSSSSGLEHGDNPKVSHGDGSAVSPSGAEIGVFSPETPRFVPREIPAGQKSGVFQPEHPAFRPGRSWRGRNRGQAELHGGNLTALHLEAVRVRRGKRTVLAIDDQEWPIDQPLAITGANGSGKSTLARWLSGLGQTKTGTMTVDGTILVPRQRLGACYLVAQNTNHQLFSDTVLGEILLAGKAQRPAHHKAPQTEVELDEAAAHQILADLDLDQMADRHPLTLSGGERQRLVIAVAMASQRRVVILDEPTSGLDATHMRQVAAGIRTLHASGAAVIVITHDADLVALTCASVVRLDAGCVTEHYPLDEPGLARIHATLAPTRIPDPLNTRLSQGET